MNENENGEPVAKNPKHINIATEMADEILKFPAIEQNEMVKHVCSIVRNSRINQVEAMKKEVEYLSQLLNDL